MNFRLHNADLRILAVEARRPRFGLAPGWSRVDWKPTTSGGNLLFIRQLVLPPNCSVRRTDVKIEAPPNLYEPAGSGRLIFYRNIWISPKVMVGDRRRTRWRQIPRLFGRDADGFAYLCIHSEPVAPGKNILEVIRQLDLYLLNPGD